MLDKEDVIGMARTMTAGYCSHTPLTDVERSMLHFLVCCRMAVEATMSLYAHSLQPSNAYIIADIPGSWALLDRLWHMTDAQVHAFNFGS